MGKVVQRLTFWEKAGYGFGDLASVLFWQTITAYLLYFYTDVFGITAAAAGTMILVSRIWDGINDPLMGIIADRTNTRWGKFRPYLLWCSVPLAIMGVLTFTTPDLSYSGKIIYAYVTFILFMMLYTAINIPYSSLLGVITPDTIERTSVSSYKYVFAYLSGTIVSITALPLTQYLGGGNEAAGWQKTMMVYGAAAVIFFFIAFVSTKERVAPPPRQKSSVKDDLKDLINNKPWLILLAATIFMVLFVATRISVIPHYFKYYVEEQQMNLFGTVYNLGFVELTSAFNGIGQISAIVGVLCTKWFASLFGKKKAFIVLFIISIISNAAFYVLQPTDVYWIFILQIIYSLTSGPLTPLIWAMYADSADYSEWKNKRRATGLVFSASTMSQKFGWAFGTAFAGWLLTLVGYKANIAQSDAVKEGLRLLVSLIPAFIGILSLIVMLFYKLNEDTMSNIASELEERRKNRNDDLAVT
ncbi:MFS transporter [Melioribacter sp. Ez-97]|uniref:MFS transporter n=1 Tax=Melioribacter sp. Ez-97 TaxID=3423434 RepID=UPI003EDA7AAA